MGNVLRGLFALLFGLVCWATASTGHAYEDQFGVAIDATYGRVLPDSTRPDGALIGLTTSLGLDDTWTTRLRLAYGAHPATDDNPETLQVGLGSVELLYLFDILEWVPYFGAGVDVMSLNESDGFSVEPGGHLAAGLDWLPTRDLVFGLDLRALTVVSLLDERPFYLAFTVSAGWLFPL